METMRAVLLTGHGGLDQLEYREDVPVPVPRADEVLIEVHACGINNTDINTRTGWYSKQNTGEPTSDDDGIGTWSGQLILPRIQGADPVGRIVTVGKDGDQTLIGRRVLVDAWLRSSDGLLENAGYLGSEIHGGFAEYVAVPAANVYPIQTDLSDVELAGFPCSFATAEHMLARAGVIRGQVVLVTGASGGVGGALIQLARRRRARVVAVTSASKVDDVRAIGADIVIDRTMPDLGEVVLEATNGIDVFADVVGGVLFAELFETIRPGGHYTTAGAIGGPIVPLDLRTLYLRDLTMHGATVLPPEVFANLIGYIERGEIKPVIAGTYPLEEMAKAQEAFMRKEHVGSLVIEVAR